MDDWWLLGQMQMVTRCLIGNVGTVAIECEHRWRYLRDRYTRERKRKSQQTNQTISKAGNWPLAKQMHFIQDFIKHRRYCFQFLILESLA